MCDTCNNARVPFSLSGQSNRQAKIASYEGCQLIDGYTLICIIPGHMLQCSNLRLL